MRIGANGELLITMQDFDEYQGETFYVHEVCYADIDFEDNRYFQIGMSTVMAFYGKTVKEAHHYVLNFVRDEIVKYWDNKLKMTFLEISLQDDALAISYTNLINGRRYDITDEIRDMYSQ